jgi:hypothetical protein
MASPASTPPHLLVHNVVEQVTALGRMLLEYQASLLESTRVLSQIEL